MFLEQIAMRREFPRSDGVVFIRNCLNDYNKKKCFNYAFRSQHLSFSFTFFVHGDTVCASIDLREHPAVRPLTKEHLSEAAAAFAAASAAQQPNEQNSIENVDAAVSDLRDRTTTSNGTLKPRKVILAPFGLSATLTGNSYKSSDPMAEKILEDWSSFFPLCNKESSDVPPVVEVIIGKNIFGNFL